MKRIIDKNGNTIMEYSECHVREFDLSSRDMRMSEENALFLNYQNKMNDTQWRFDNRMNIDLFIEIDEIVPRGQCGPIYRPMNEVEFESKCNKDLEFKNLWRL